MSICHLRAVLRTERRLYIGIAGCDAGVEDFLDETCVDTQTEVQTFLVFRCTGGSSCCRAGYDPRASSSEFGPSRGGICEGEAAIHKPVEDFLIGIRLEVHFLVCDESAFVERKDRMTASESVFGDEVRERGARRMRKRCRR